MTDSKLIADLRMKVEKCFKGQGWQFSRMNDMTYTVDISNTTFFISRAENGNTPVFVFLRENGTETYVIIQSLLVSNIEKVTSDLILFLNQKNGECDIGSFRVDLKEKCVVFEYGLVGNYCTEGEIIESMPIISVIAKKYEKDVHDLCGGKFLRIVKNEKADAAAPAVEKNAEKMMEKPGSKFPEIVYSIKANWGKQDKVFVIEELNKIGLHAKNIGTLFGMTSKEVRELKSSRPEKRLS